MVPETLTHEDIEPVPFRATGLINYKKDEFIKS